MIRISATKLHFLRLQSTKQLLTTTKYQSTIPTIPSTLIGAVGQRSRSLATAAQKRALNEQQLTGAKDVGSSTTSTTTTTGTTAKPPSATVKAPDGGSGSSSSGGSGGGGGVLLPAVGLIGVAAGGAYYMELIPDEYLTMVGLGSSGAVVTKESSPSKVVPKANVVPKKVVVAPETSKTKTVDTATTTPVTTTKETKVEQPPSKKTTDEYVLVDKIQTTPVSSGRVTQIHAPPKDETRILSPPPPVQHATDAHKVTTVLPQTNNNTPTTTNTTTTDQSAAVENITAATVVEAQLELRPPGTNNNVDEELTKAHAALRANLDDTLFKDLDSLTYSQLRIRVVQLASEMQERTKWEAVRLREFLAMKEKEAEERHLTTLQTQRLEFQDLLARRLREQEDTLTRATNTLLTTKEAAFESILTSTTKTQDSAYAAQLESTTDRIQREIGAKAEAEFGQKLAEEKVKFVQELENRAKALEELAERLVRNDEMLEISRNFEGGSQIAHRVSAAALALAERMETREGAGEEVAALKAAAVENGVIAAALEKIPRSVRTGVPTLPELQTLFDEVHSVGRQAAHVPTGRSGLEGQIAGMLFAKMTVTPSPDSAPPVGDDGNMADYTLASARRHVQLGNLEEAVRELDKLKGQTAFTMGDWKKTAMDRIAVEKALKVIKMECALMNKNMAG